MRIGSEVSTFGSQYRFYALDLYFMAVQLIACVDRLHLTFPNEMNGLMAFVRAQVEFRLDILREQCIMGFANPVEEIVGYYLE